jgi:hypothetical protein
MLFVIGAGSVIGALAFVTTFAGNRGRLVFFTAGIVFGYLAFKCYLLFRDPRPVLRISASGIEDRQNGFELIPWEEIKGANIRYGPGNRYGPSFRGISLNLRDKDRLIRDLSGSQRFWLRWKQFTGSKDICLDFSWLRGDPEQALLLIRKYSRLLEPRALTYDVNS